MKSRNVHLARDGKVIGQYTAVQLASLLDTGSVRPTDLCYSEAHPEWTPVEEFIAKAGVEKFARAGTPRQEHSTDNQPARTSSGRRPSRKRAAAHNALVGAWMAFLLTAAALVGSVFWIISQHEEISKRDSEIAKLKEEISVKDKENQKLLFVSREIAEPGTVRGSFVLRNDGGKRIAMPGVEVQLYKRNVIESHLDQRFAEIPAGEQPDAIKFLLTGLSTPHASTTTDASGRFDFLVPDPDEYVVVAVVASPTPRLWFVSFDSRDALNTLVEINEANAVQQLVRSLMIVSGR